MNAVLAILAFICAALLVIVILAVFDQARHRRAGALVEARCRDLDEYRRQSLEAIAAFTNAALTLSRRESDQMALVLNAALADRERLVTALLAASTNPTSARVLGMVDQARVGAERNGNMREYLEAQMADRARDSETTTADGEPIIPVGLGSS